MNDQRFVVSDILQQNLELHFTGIADLLGVLERSKFALNVAFLVCHEYFLHPKAGNLQEVP
ncbi:MAG: hypothetical protein P8N30_04975 [Tateyamaria sp.]|nr:hypothetical protein [Tateyamaria sp.]